MGSLKVVSFSELWAARQCPLKHQLSYVERWSKEQDTMSALSKGTAWHQVLEVHYLELQKLQKANPGSAVAATQMKSIRTTVETFIEYTVLPVSAELADLIWWMYLGYVECFDSDPSWRILAVEHSAQCRLPTPSGRPSGFILKMKIDLIIGTHTARGGKQIWIVDHKSGKDLPKDKELDLDDQFGLYTWGLQKMGKQVFGQIHNAARTLRLKEDEKLWGTKDYTPGDATALDTRFMRSRMYRTDIELQRIAVEAYQVMQGRYTEQQRATRAGTDSPRHPDPKGCRWMCDYVDACLMGRKTDGQQMREYLDAKNFRQDYDRHLVSVVPSHDTLARCP